MDAFVAGCIHDVGVIDMTHIPGGSLTAAEEEGNGGDGSEAPRSTVSDDDSMSDANFLSLAFKSAINAAISRRRDARIIVSLGFYNDPEHVHDVSVCVFCFDLCIGVDVVCGVEVWCVCVAGVKPGV